MSTALPDDPPLKWHGGWDHEALVWKQTLYNKENENEWLTVTFYGEPWPPIWY